MKKTTSRILTLSLVGALTLTLASCSKETRNQVTPYGNISEAKTAISINNNSNTYSVTEKELYNRLKYQYGYTLFTENLESKLFSEELKTVKYEGDTKKDIDTEVAKAIYGTDDLEKLKQMAEKDLELSRKKYKDTMSQQGVKINDINTLKFDEITRDTESVSFSNLPKNVINEFKLAPAKKEASKKYLESIADKETIQDENDSNIINDNPYYIDKDAIVKEYEDNYKKHNTSHGIILRFNSLRDAEEAIKDVTGGKNVLEEANLAEQYIKLFNNYYSYSEDKLNSVSDINTNELTTFKTNDELTQLASFSANVESLFLDTLKDNKGLLKPMNIDKKYYLVFRSNVTYKTNTTEEIRYDELEDKLGKDEANKIKAELKANIIDSKIDSVASKVYENKLEGVELKIYDPFLENTFANSYNFYEYVSSSNNDVIYEGKDIKYTVDDFYKDLKSYNLDSTVVDLLLNKYLYDTQKSYLGENEQSDFEKSLKEEIKAFKKGDKTINQAYGEELYLFATYGYMTESEVVANKMASSILDDYLTDYISDAWATEDHKINQENTGFIQKIIDSALEVIKTKKLFDINIDHILISVDNDQDGNPDNMKTFLDSLNKEEKAKFEKAVLDLTNAIVREVNAINRKDTLEKLQYIVEAFNNNEKLTADPNDPSKKTWADYKTYKFVLKAESLGNVDESSVKNYVTEFKEYVENLFDKVVKDNLEIPEDKEGDGIIYFNREGDTKGNNYENLTYDEICYSEFGFHIISVNSYKKDSTTLNFELSKDSDSAGNWRDLKVILDDKEIDDKNDDIYVITDIYKEVTAESGKEIPSFNQAFVYFVEKTNGSVTSIKSSIKNNLSTLLDEVIEKYKTNSFQKYLLITEVFSNVNKDNLTEFNLESYLEYLKNSNESYDTESYYYNNWYNNSFWK